MQNIMGRYAVMGNPIAHSLSPLIHKLFAAQTQQTINYETILVEPDQFAQAIKDFQAQNGKGLNITLPFKETAFALVDKASLRAKAAKAVNTITFNADGTSEGDNTDGVGLVRDLTENLSVTLQEKNILLLGAGGAVRGLLPLLLEQQPQRLVIANRTASRAQQLVEDFNPFTAPQVMSASGYDNLPSVSFDIVIHATAAGILNSEIKLPSNLSLSNSYCYDLTYSKTAELTSFLQVAKNQGCKHYADGLGMLVEQAAEAFYLWHGVRPRTAEVIKELRK